MRINSILDDEEIEECIEGSSNVSMIREIIDKTQLNNLIDIEDFADMFSYAIRGYIDADVGSEVYEEAYLNNWTWGETIATNINSLLVDKWTK